MRIRRQLHTRGPKIMNLKSEAKQHAKSFHIRIGFRNGIQRLVQTAKRVAVNIGILKRHVTERLPRVSISTRSVVAKKMTNALIRDDFEARSKDGIAISKEEAEELKTLGEEVEIESTPERPGDLDANPQMKLKRIGKRALAERHADAVEARKALQNMKTIKDKDIPLSELHKMQEKKVDAEAKYRKLRSYAVKIEFNNIGRKYGTAHALEVMEDLKSKLTAADDDSFSLAEDGVLNTMISSRVKLHSIDAKVMEIALKYQGEVYEKVAPFIDEPDGDHQKLVNDQKLRQLTLGTEKLKFATKERGFEGRLPGLDYYVCRAKELLKGQHAEDADYLREASSMMLFDWTELSQDMRDQMRDIRTDKTSDTPGKFDTNRMWDYHHLDSFNQTIKLLEQLANSKPDEKSGIRINGKLATPQLMVATYGEELGLDIDADSEKHTAAVKEKYGVSEFKPLSDSLSDRKPGVQRPVQPQENLLVDPENSSRPSMSKGAASSGSPSDLLLDLEDRGSDPISALGKEPPSVPAEGTSNANDPFGPIQMSEPANKSDSQT